MQANRTIVETASPPAETDAHAQPSRRRTPPARRGPARLLGVLRGDKYMANAYPPEWQSPARAAETHRADTTRTSGP